MTQKEIDKLLVFGSSHITPFYDDILMEKGVTKFQVFLSIKPLLKGKLYWYALKEAYQMSDDLLFYKEDVRLAFNSDEPDRRHLMNKMEQKHLESLPKNITIFRGMTKEEKDNQYYGVSWTLKKERADYFANAFGRNYATQNQKKVVHKLNVDKDKIVAFFNDRNEFEVIYLHPFKKRLPIPD